MKSLSFAVSIAAMFALVSCASNVPPPEDENAEAWTPGIQSSYPDWQPPEEMPDGNPAYAEAVGEPRPVDGIRGHENVIPKKDTVIEEGDRVVVGTGAEADKDIAVEEIMIGARSEWADSTVADLAAGLDVICVMIKRGEERIFPKGSTVVRSGDAIIVLARAVGGRR